MSEIPKDAVNVLDYWDGTRTKRGLIDLTGALPKAVAAAKAGARGEVFFPAGTYAGFSDPREPSDNILFRGGTNDPADTKLDFDSPA